MRPDFLVASDPSEGVHLITPSFTKYLTSISSSQDEESRYLAFGKVEFIAANSKRTMCALLCRSDSGGQARLIVTTADFAEELNRQNLPSGKVKDLYWCGSACIVLVFTSQIALVGPHAQEFVDMSGLAYQTEIDGLRILTDSEVLFLDMVQDSTIETFGLA